MNLREIHWSFDARIIAVQQKVCIGAKADVLVALDSTRQSLAGRRQGTTV